MVSDRNDSGYPVALDEPATWLDNKLTEWRQHVAVQVAEERERCAQVCDALAQHYRDKDGLHMDFVDGEELAVYLADKIRGNKK